MSEVERLFLDAARPYRRHLGALATEPRSCYFAFNSGARYDMRGLRLIRQKKSRLWVLTDLGQAVHQALEMEP